MNKKEQILTKFYELHEKPSNIAKELEVTSAYITKIIKSDIEKKKTIVLLLVQKIENSIKQI